MTKTIAVRFFCLESEAKNPFPLFSRLLRHAREGLGCKHILRRPARWPMPGTLHYGRTPKKKVWKSYIPPCLWWAERWRPLPCGVSSSCPECNECSHWADWWPGRCFCPVSTCSQWQDFKHLRSTQPMTDFKYHHPTNERIQNIFPKPMSGFQTSSPNQWEDSKHFP